MAIDVMNYEPRGDKKNSDFFNEYRLKIYERRTSSGLDQILGEMKGIVVQVENGDAIAYICELYLMGPYRFSAAYQNDTHRIYILTSNPSYPRLFILEPLTTDYEDEVTMFNRL